MPERGEFALIAEVFAPLAATAPGALGLRDDAALIDPPPGCQLVATTDAIVAGVHFLPDDPPALVARKLLRVNLSDLAAMGAAPLGVLSACAFPRGGGAAWITAFATGLAEDLRSYGVSLLGGDTVATPGPATFALTALGTVPAGQALTRAGARPGDLIAVTGTLGDGALGLLAARGELAGTIGDEAIATLADRYRLPQPRVACGIALRGLARAGLDISDGLIQDLGHLAAASGVAVRVEAARLPLSASAAGLLAVRPDLRPLVATGGDDYELALAIPPEHWEAAVAACAAHGVPLNTVGACLPPSAAHSAGVVRLVDGDGVDLTPPGGGYSHF